MRSKIFEDYITNQFDPCFFPSTFLIFTSHFSETNRNESALDMKDETSSIFNRRQKSNKTFNESYKTMGRRYSICDEDLGRYEKDIEKECKLIGLDIEDLLKEYQTTVESNDNNSSSISTSSTTNPIYQLKNNQESDSNISSTILTNYKYLDSKIEIQSWFLLFSWIFNFIAFMAYNATVYAYYLLNPVLNDDEKELFEKLMWWGVFVGDFVWLIEPLVSIVGSFLLHHLDCQWSSKVRNIQSTSPFLEHRNNKKKLD